MTNERKSRQKDLEQLRDILKRVLEGHRFMLDCGHHQAVLLKRSDNETTMVSGWEFKIVCRWCGE